MAETVTVTENTTATDAENQERTFTQSELNEIVTARVKKEREKFADYTTLQEKASKFDEMEEASKSELQKATERADKLQKELDKMTKANEVQSTRNKVANDTGVPANLLTGKTEEECMEQAYAILSFKNQNAYPSVKDGGEAQNTVSKKSVEQQFADWFNASVN